MSRPSGQTFDMRSRGAASFLPPRDSRENITKGRKHKHDLLRISNKYEQQRQQQQQQPEQLTTICPEPEIKLLKRSSHSTFSYYLKMLIISASLVIIHKHREFTLKVAAQQLDLIELLRQQQQQQLQLNPQTLPSESQSFVSAPAAAGQTYNKRLGMLECVAKLHGRFHDELSSKLTSGNNNQNQQSITQPAQSQQHAPPLTWPPPGASPGHSQLLLLNQSNHGDHHNQHQQGPHDNRPQIIFLPSGDSVNQGGEEETTGLQPVDDGDQEGQQVIEQNEDVEGVPDDQQAVEEQFVDQVEGEEGDEPADLSPDYEDQQQQQRQEIGVHNVSGTTTIYQDRRDVARRTWTGGLTALANRLKPPDLTNALKRKREAANRRRGHPRRFKRQTAPSDGGQQAVLLTNSIAQLITNALLGARQRNAQFGQLQATTASNSLDSSASNQAATPNPIQAALGTVVPIGQQLLNELLSQGARDIPVRMANVGQLLANLIVTLTVNNPVLVNSPLLARARPILRQATTAGGNQLADAQPVGIMSVLTNVIRALNQSQPTMGPQTRRPTPASTTLAPPSPSELETSLPAPMSTFPPTLDFEPTVSSLFAPDNLLLAASQRIDLKSAQTYANKTLSSPRRKVNHHKKSKMIQDQDSNTVAFVRRLNALTTGEVLSKNVTRVKEKGTQKRTGRSKRSLGALMMFGPFSKFYMAMTLHRLMKYQSGVLSQAVMGELVRRYVIPGFSSALTGGGGGVSGSGGSSQASQQLINQARQIFMRSTNPSSNPAADIAGLRANITRSPVVGSVPQNVDFKSKPPLTQQELLLQQLRSLGPDQRTAEAECEFQHANGLDLLGRAVRFTTPLDMQQLYQLLQTSWGSYLTHAMNNPFVSFEPGRGLTISLPISQSSMTIPSLRSNRQQALVELLTQSSARDHAHRPLVVHGRPDLHQLLLRHPAHSAHHSHGKAKRRPNRYHSGASFHPDDSEPIQQQQQQQQTNDHEERGPLGQEDVQQVLGAFLKQASPDQLFEVLNRTILASQAGDVRPRNAHKSGARLKEKIANGQQGDQQIQKQQLKLLQALMGSLNKTDSREGETSKDSVSGLADKLLSKSLASLMESLLKQDLGGSGGNALKQGGEQQFALMKSMMLDSVGGSGGGGDEGQKLGEKVVGQLLGSLNQHRRRPEQQVTGTGPEETENNKPSTRDIKPGIQLTLTADNATTLMDKLMALTGTNKTAEQIRNPNLMDSNESVLQPQEQRNELVRLDHHLVQPTLPSASPPEQLRSRSSAPYHVNGTSMIPRQPHTVTGSGHAMVSLAKQVSTSVHSGRSSAASSSAASLMNNNNHTIRQQLLGRNMTLVHIEPIDPNRMGNGTVALTLRPDDVQPPIASGSHFGPNLTNHQVVSVNEPTKRDQGNQSQDSHGQPLNNLAMALNVMNMVMLNQRLMSAGNSTTGSGQSPMLPRAGTATTITGNFSLNNSRILLPSAGTKHKTRPMRLVSGRSRSHTGQTKRARAKYTTIANRGQMAAYIYPSRTAVVVDATTMQSTNIGSTTTTTTTSAPEFVLLNVTHLSKSADRKPNASDFIRSANHRTSTNTIRLHQNLSLLDETAKPTATSTIAPPKYYFQPLVTKPNSSVTFVQNDKTKLRLSQQKGEESVEPESDHADRWNDVLQHIDLPALSV